MEKAKDSVNPHFLLHTIEGFAIACCPILDGQILIFYLFLLLSASKPRGNRRHISIRCLHFLALQWLKGTAEVECSKQVPLRDNNTTVPHIHKPPVTACFSPDLYTSSGENVFPASPRHPPPWPVLPLQLLGPGCCCSCYCHCSLDLWNSTKPEFHLPGAPGSAWHAGIGGALPNIIICIYYILMLYYINTKDRNSK